jgi:uncharacterized protein YecT (DUF1311 family)
MPVLATLLFGAALMQDPPAPGAAYAACLDRASGVTSEMRDCSAAEYERQDQALNATYRDLMARLPAELKTELRDAQRAWIGFRDAECDYRSLAQGGTLGLLVRDSCWLDLTTARVARLRDELEIVTELGAPY